VCAQGVGGPSIWSQISTTRINPDHEVICVFSNSNLLGMYIPMRNKDVGCMHFIRNQDTSSFNLLSRSW